MTRQNSSRSPLYSSMDSRDMSYVEAEELSRQESHPLNLNKILQPDYEQDQETASAPGPSNLYYLNNDHAVKATLVCTILTVSIYGIARIQGRIRTDVHAGLNLFWNCLIFGDVAICVTTSMVAVYTYFSEGGHPENLTCISIAATTKYSMLSYLWVFFAIAALRSIIAISWLNQIRNVEHLLDLVHGIGLICLSLIYIIPLSLIIRHHVDGMDGDQGDMVCMPTFRNGMTVETLMLRLTAAWMLALVLAKCISENKPATLKRTITGSLSVILIAIATYFIPTMTLFIWLNSGTLNMDDYRDTVPAIYAAIATLSALSNFVMYKLFTMATEDAAESKTKWKCSKCSFEEPV